MRRSLRLLCLFFIVAAAISFLAALAVGAAHQKAPITLCLEAPKQPLKAGERLLLRVKITNTSDHALDVGIMAGKALPMGFIYQVYLRDQHGRAAPLQPPPPPPPHPKGTVVGRAYSLHGVGLKPGQSAYDRVNVTYYYDLSQPGKYKIWIAEPYYRGPHVKNGLARSNTITVTVVK